MTGHVTRKSHDWSHYSARFPMGGHQREDQRRSKEPLGVHPGAWKSRDQSHYNPRFPESIEFAGNEGWHVVNDVLTSNEKCLSSFPPLRFLLSGDDKGVQYLKFSKQINCPRNYCASYFQLFFFYTYPQFMGMWR